MTIWALKNTIQFAGPPPKTPSGHPFPKPLWHCIISLSEVKKLPIESPNIKSQVQVATKQVKEPYVFWFFLKMGYNWLSMIFR